MIFSRESIMKRIAMFLFVFGLYHYAVPPAQAVIQYTITDLGMITDTNYISGIDNGGRVVGYLSNEDGSMMAFRTASNQPLNLTTDNLGTLGGSFSYAFGINNNGQVVGGSLTSIDENHAFRTGANQPINPATDDLGTLGGSMSYALGINDSGHVVGYASVSSDAIHAFRTAPNQPINPNSDDLGTLGGALSYAYGINKAGQVVGDALTSDGADHAFRTAPNQPINPLTDDLGTLGGDISNALSINNLGQVVGWSSTASGIQNAFLFSGNGSMQDLNSLIDPASGWSLNSATGINELGQIVGSGILGSNAHAFLLTPVPFEWQGGNALNPSDWGKADNWNPNASVPNGPGTKVNFGNQPAAFNVVDIVSGEETVGSMTFAGMTSTTIKSSGGRRLTLDNGGSVSTISVTGTHTISAPVVLDDDAIIMGSGTLYFNGGITGNHALNVTDGYLNASNIIVNTLTIGSPVAAVPEPSILVFLSTPSFIGLLALLGRWWRYWA
jgi:probable HAF family extracellular repeat protein